MAQDYLMALEAEATAILLEVSREFNNVVILYSGGKDSTVLAHLAHRAFYPRKIPFKFLHIDTGQNFPETLKFRDELARELNIEMIVGSVEECILKGLVTEKKGPGTSRNALQSSALMQEINKYQFDALIGGARRDEEKARAKERIFSHRESSGSWRPEHQRPELWNLYNTKKHEGEHFRVFPISNWTELDIWEYIKRHNIKLPSLYFAHEREVFYRAGAYYAFAPYLELFPGEQVEIRKVRFRTMGDLPCTGGELSEASTLDQVIQEISESRLSERGMRADDKVSQTAMEERKKHGYF